MGAAASECTSQPRQKATGEQLLPGVAESEALPDWEGRRPQALAGCECKRVLSCDVGEDCLMACSLSADALDDQECADVLLMQAATRGDLEDVEKALSRGACVDNCAELALNMGVRDHKRVRRVTPLMRACEAGHQEVARRLLLQRADPWRFDTRNWTPLCYALGAGELEVGRVLLQDARGAAADSHRAMAERLQRALLEHCEVSAGDERAEELRQALAPGGFLHRQPRRV
mmetsp:Transcript_582/g.1827  ORF Transcript_582/g.1827 Transcript_582/m.1827 type:complete len:231 (-) Transcript_582:103-795(-)